MMKRFQEWLDQLEKKEDGKSKKTSKAVQSYEAGASEVETEFCTFDYDVKNFRYLTEKITSPIFTGGVKSGHEWRVTVTPTHAAKGKDYVGVMLKLNKSSNGKSVSAYCSLNLLNSNRKIVHSGKSTTIQDFGDGKGCGWYWNLRRDALEPDSRYMSQGHTLKFQFQILMVVGVTHKKLSSQKDTTLSERLQNTTLDSEEKVGMMKSFLTYGNFSDVLLKTSTNTFPASKIILAAQSPVFNAIFSSEANQNILKIEDFSDEVVQRLLEFLYTGECEMLEKNPKEMLSIADKYQVTGLKNKCESTLLNNLTIENACDVLTAAHLYSSTSFKSTVVSFINRNKTQVQETDSYKKMVKLHPDILN